MPRAGIDGGTLGEAATQSAHGSKGSSGNGIAQGAGVSLVPRGGGSSAVARGREGKTGMMSKVKGRISGFFSELKEEVLRED